MFACNTSSQQAPFATLRSSVPPRHASALAHANGFTLVELLVALGLISLLMLMFAEVFTVATGTMSTQRGVMENDQRARTLETVLGNDLANRSMRSVVPFLPNEIDPAGNGNPLNLPLLVYQFGNTNREGFLSISENDVFLDNDVLHFTAFLRDTAAEPFYGRAAGLPVGTADITTNPNQPDADDGQVFPNGTATSRSAEIVYFVRNGNLYRRVLLIRQPLDGAFDNQPKTGTSGTGLDMLAPANGFYSATGPFWNHFDFSARYDTILGYAQFQGAGTTVSPLGNTGAGGFFPIANPVNRFGHDPNPAHSNPASGGYPASIGNPREFVFGNPPAAGPAPPSNKNAYFIGRFTQEETSHANFRFPQNASTVGNPMDQDVQLTLNASGAVTQFAGGPRRGEDILLTNVHGFDVKVWDELLGDYVDVGHDRINTLSGPSGREGDFNQLRNLRPTYGPQATTTNRMFDTWHPAIDADNSGAVGASDVPPFVQKYGYPTSPTATSPTPKGHMWVSGTTYSVGEIVVPTSPTTELIAYRLTAPAGGGTSNTEPNWSSAPNVGDTVTADGLTWTAIANIKRLKSLKITVRYLDPTSDQMRQVTLIQSLMD